MRGLTTFMLIGTSVCTVFAASSAEAASSKKSKAVAAPVVAPTTTTVPANPFTDLTSDAGSPLTAVSVVATGNFDRKARTDVTTKCQPERTGLNGKTSTLCLATVWQEIALSGGMAGQSSWAVSSAYNNPMGSSPAGNAVFVGTIAGCGTGALVLQMAPTYADAKYPPITVPGFAAEPPYRVEVARFSRYDDFIGIEGEGVLLPATPKADGTLDFTIKLNVRCIAH